MESTHPRYSSRANSIPILFSTCPICGKMTDPSCMRYGLSVCNDHYVENAVEFLTRGFYLKLKEENNAELASDPLLTYEMINRQLRFINLLWGWEPEKLSEEQHLIFAETCALDGYLLLRAMEAVPDLKEIMYSAANSKRTVPRQPKVGLRSKADRLLLLIQIEFELFLAIKWAASGYFDIAVDNGSSPSYMLIVPRLLEETATSVLRHRLRDANEEWHGTFMRLMFPTGTSTARDESGTYLRFNRIQIRDNFEAFKEVWNEAFNADTQMTPTDFDNLWGWLEWVITQDGITEGNQTKATYFDEYKSFGLRKDLVFETLSEVLPDIGETSDRISLAGLARAEPYLTAHIRLADLARGFRISTSKGKAYYFPCRKWFYGKLMPVFITFLRRIGLPGDLFEEDMIAAADLYSKSGVRVGGESMLGVMIEPRFGETPKIKTSRSIPWRILEKRLPISLPDDSVTKSIGRTGDIDLVVYANMNLYLIELKGLNLEGRNALKYMKEVAPVQCAKYSAWARNQQELSKFLEKHEIKQDQLASVRVVVCSAGVFRDLEMVCKETGEAFAIVPEFVLFSTMSGLFTVSLRHVFPLRIENIAPGLRVPRESVSFVRRIDSDTELGVLISRHLLSWTRLITFDRRQEFEYPTVDDDSARAFSMFGTSIVHEAYFQETTSWILPKPVLVSEEGNYRFYLGTQLGVEGTTMVCENCRSAIKFYPPRDSDEASKRIQATLEASVCPFCGEKSARPDDVRNVRETMTRVMSRFKAELGESLA